VNLGLAVNYYFSEREGVEISYIKTNATESDMVNRLAGNGAIPDHNLAQYYIGASYNWIPIYAKLSLLEKKILYFDMSVSPGLGITQLRSSSYTSATARDQSDITFSLDLAQQVFLTEHWAIRVDLKNHFYQEQIYGALSGSQLNTKMTYTGEVMLGVTFFQ
jgi:outer membrane beta-barrel protein